MGLAGNNSFLVNFNFVSSMFTGFPLFFFLGIANSRLFFNNQRLFWNFQVVADHGTVFFLAYILWTFKLFFSYEFQPYSGSLKTTGQLFNPITFTDDSKVIASGLSCIHTICFFFLVSQPFLRRLRRPCIRCSCKSLFLVLIFPPMPCRKQIEKTIFMVHFVYMWSEHTYGIKLIHFTKCTLMRKMWMKIYFALKSVLFVSTHSYIALTCHICQIANKLIVSVHLNFICWNYNSSKESRNLLINRTENILSFSSSFFSY